MSHEEDTKPPYAVYTYHVTDPTETITQALATAARTKRGNSSNGSGSTTIKMENPYKAKSGLSSSISQFLAKLWRLVNDEDTDDKICWSEDGISFIVKDQASFSMELLPRYFKHHNFSSFVRQLNMYGFRKVVNTEHGGLRCIKDDYQFVNKNFCRDRPELLELVKRKPSSSTQPNMHQGKETDENIASTLKKVLTEVHHLKKDNDRIRHSFEKLKEENTKVFNEVENLNKKNNNQSVIIQKIIKFIWSLAHQQNSISKQSRMMIENGDRSGSRYGEIVDPNWTEEQRSQPVSPAGPRSPSRYGERVNKVGSDLQSIQSLLSSQNLPFDVDVVNDLFEYNSEYVSPPAMSPAPGSSYNGSAPPSPAGPSGVNTAAATSSPSYNVQVEQYPEETVPSTMSMASPSYIQHPSSPVANQRQTSPARSPHHQRHISPSPSPVQISPHISPNVSPHVSPYISPHVSPHISPHVSPHMSPHTSPAHSVSYQQNVGMQGGSPVRQQFPQQYDHYNRSPGKQPYPGYVPDRGGGMSTEHVVKKPKLSAYTQNIQWDEEDYGEEEESKIDPSTFFTK